MNSLIKRSLLTPVSISLFVALSACSSNPQLAGFENIEQSAKRSAAMADESPARSIQLANEQRIKAEKSHLSFYAPRHLKYGQEELAKAKVMHTSGDADGVVKTQAKLAQKAFENGLKIRKNILKDFDPAIKDRDNLLKIKAPQHFPEDFVAIEKGIGEFIDLMETGQNAEAKVKQRTLRAQMRTLEVKTIEHRNLQPVKDLLKRVEVKGGDDVAAMTYKQAQQELKKAQRVIAKNPKAKRAIANAKARAMDAAERADVITNYANQVLKSDEKKAEILALRIEEWFKRSGDALELGDLRSKPFAKQSEAIVKGINKNK